MNIEKTSEHKSVVTCKDCTFCYIKDMAIGTCDNRWGMTGTVRPDDYCSRGRKREGRDDRRGRT